MLSLEREGWLNLVLEGSTLCSLAESGKAVGAIYGLDCLLQLNEVLRQMWADLEEEQVREAEAESEREEEWK